MRALTQLHWNQTLTIGGEYPRRSIRRFFTHIDDEDTQSWTCIFEIKRRGFGRPPRMRVIGSDEPVSGIPRLSLGVKILTRGDL